MAKWIQSFEVPSTSGRGTYTVSQDRDGKFGCSCPQWKFRRVSCKHILRVQEQVQTGPQSFERVSPTCVPANVRAVRKRDEGTLLVPLLPTGDPHFLATVVVDLLMHGVQFFEIRHRYHLPSGARRQDYIDHVLRYGRRIYGSRQQHEGSRSLETTQSWHLPEPFLPNEQLDAYHHRTGYPLDLVTLALQRLPTTTFEHSPLPPRTPPLQSPARKFGQRRIIPSNSF